MSDELRQEDDDFDLSSLHDLEMADGDDDAEFYNPPDPPPSFKPPPKQEVKAGDESSKPMLTRQSEENPNFSIGDDEFGTWAEEENDK